jgi:hypothetical protein
VCAIGRRSERGKAIYNNNLALTPESSPSVYDWNQQAVLRETRQRDQLKGTEIAGCSARSFSRQRCLDSSALRSDS